jgi:hypothetical protein
MHSYTIAAVSSPITTAFDRQAAGRPDAPFLVTLERSFSYG